MATYTAARGAIPPCAVAAASSTAAVTAATAIAISVPALASASTGSDFSASDASTCTRGEVE